MDVTVAIVTMIPVILAVALIISVVRKNITREPGEPIHIVEAVPAVIVLAVAVMIIGGMAESVEDNEFELYECVPAETFGEGYTISGDAAELVTIGGEPYVRMTDLGSFTITKDGEEKDYSVVEAEMDLVVLAGQSNSGCYFTNPSFYDGDPTISPGIGFYLGQTSALSDDNGGNLSESIVSTATICDMIADDGSMRLSAMYPTLYADYYKETGHRLMTVSTGIGGRFITAWDDDGRADVFMTDAMERLQNQCEGRISLNPVAVLWTQGEADFSNTEAYYLEHFEPLLDKFKDGYYAGYEFPHVTASLPRREMASIDDMIPPALAQISVAETDPYFSIASELAYRATAEQMRDDVHFDQEYYEWIGEAFARQVALLTGYTRVNETIVLAEDIGVVDELPAKVECYGTSGKGYQLNASWSESGTAGTFEASLSGNPYRTSILSGLTATASYWTYDSSTKTLTIGIDVSGAENEWDANTSSEQLILTEGVTSVTGTAFSGFSSLRYVSIPSSVETIASSCFGVFFKDPFGAAISSIGPGAYMGTGNGTVYKADSTIYTYSDDGATITGLTSEASAAKYLVFPKYNGETEITSTGNATASGQMFFDNTDIVLVAAVPDSSMTTIGGNCFRGCTGITDVILPQNLTTIKNNAFQGCSGITAIDWPETLVSIELWAFFGTALTEVDLPDGITALNISVFRQCLSLKDVTISASVESIDAAAFSGCSAIETVTFGSGFDATLDASWAASWTFYDTDGTTELDKTVASNLAGSTFTGTASALVKQA